MHCFSGYFHPERILTATSICLTSLYYQCSNLFQNSYILVSFGGILLPQTASVIHCYVTVHFHVWDKYLQMEFSGASHFICDSRLHSTPAGLSMWLQSISRIAAIQGLIAYSTVLIHQWINITVIVMIMHLKWTSYMEINYRAHEKSQFYSTTLSRCYARSQQSNVPAYCTCSMSNRTRYT